MASSRDVTGWAGAEQRLTQSEERFRVHYKSLPVPTYSWRRVEEDFALVDYNNAAFEITQGRIADLLGTNASEIYSDKPEVLELLSRTFRERITIQREMPWRMATTGDSKHFVASFVFVPPDTVMVHTEDVTKRKEAEDQLRFQARLLDAVGQAIIAVDLQGDVVYWNRRAEELYGWSAQEAMGRPVTELVVSEDLQERAAEIRAELRAGKSWSGEFAVRRKDGSSFLALVTDTPVRDERGDLVGIIGVSTDLTERKKAEEELQALQREYEELIDSVEAIIWKGEARTLQFTFVSHQAEAVLGYPAERWTEEPLFWSDHIYPEDREWAVSFCTSAVADRRSHTFEYRMIAADGRVVWLRDIVHVAVEGGVPTELFGVMIDITERKEAEERLREAEERHRTLIEQIPAMVYVQELGEQSRTTYISPQIETILGYPLEESLRDPELWIKILHPGDRERVLIEDRRTNETGEPFSMEYRQITRDGRLVWVRDEAVLVRDDEGAPLYWQGVILDITERVLAEQALRESEERFRSLVQNASDVVTLYAADGTILYVSPAIEHMLGYEPEERVGTNSFELIHPDDVAQAKEAFAEALKSPNVPVSIEVRVRHRDGSWRHIETTGTNLLDDPSVGALVLNSRDVSERKRAEEELREAEERFRSAFDDAAIGMGLVNPDGRWLQVNRSLRDMLGYSEEELLEKTFQDITHPDDLDTDLEYVRRLLAGEIQTYQMEKRYFHKDGHTVWILLSVSLVRGEEGEPLYFISQIQDITERKRMEEQLRHQALHDPLTNLPNRTLFVDRLGQALRRTRRKRGLKVAVLFMDLDGFKVINDSLGHEVGDRLLVAVSERLKGCLRPEDTLTRFGGDEFTVLVEEMEDPKDAVRMAERFVEELRQPFFLDERELFVRASIGVALGDASTNRPEDLVRDADTAMYQAKEQGAHYLVFAPAMYEQVLRRLEVENDLRRAIEAGEFVLHYQPIIDIQTGEVRAVEALVRWDHPERGLLNPSEFIPVAEETGLVITMGEQILEEACRRAKEWQEEHPRVPPLVISVNLSARQLQRPDLATTIEGVLRRTGIEAQCLSLDITETVYIKALEGNTAALDELKRLGVSIAIDDFGVGYSSLSYLKRIPADALKIDKSFVTGLGEDIEDTAIVRMIIELAHTLGMEVIAEGVETAGQAAQLEEMDCDMGQGFYLIEPLPPEAVPRFLAR